MNDYFGWDEQDPLTIDKDDYVGDDDDESEEEEEEEEEMENASDSSESGKLTLRKKKTELPNKSHGIESPKTKEKSISYYNLFKSDCCYPNIHYSEEDLLSQLRNYSEINDVAILKRLIANFCDTTDNDSWEKPIETAEMIVDRDSKLWKREKTLVFVSMILLILFNKEHIDYVGSEVALMNRYSPTKVQMPLLAFCKMMTSNNSNLNKFLEKHSIKKSFEVKLVVCGEGSRQKQYSKEYNDDSSDDESLKKHNTKKKSPSIKYSIRELGDCCVSSLRVALRKNGDEYVALQQRSDMNNQDVDEFSSSFFNAGSTVSAYHSLKASIEDNLIKFIIYSGAEYC